MTKDIKPTPDAYHRRVYIANDDHTDYMWSADAETYNAVFVETLDFYLQLADETAGNPTPYQSRFNTDGSYWLWQYERRKIPADFARLIKRVKDGTISSPLNTLVSCYGAQPAEAVLRGLYYAGRLERRFGLRFTLCNATENQVLPLGLASLFAGAGARYTWRGVCACATRMDKTNLKERDREIYWYTGHDGQRLLMKWYSVGPHNIGTYTEAMNPVASMEYLETDPGFLRRHVDPVSGEKYNILGIFGFGGDDLARKTGVTPPPEIPAVPGLQRVPSSPYCDHFHVIAEQQATDERTVIVSNEWDFFEDFERHYGASLAAHAVTHGNEWDLYSASMSETSARVKRAVEKLRAAELLATLVSLHYPPFMKNHVGARDEAFTDLGLFWEHDWTADGPVTRGQRAAWQDKLAANIEYYVHSIYAEGIMRLGGMIPRPNRTHRFFVLNPLGWPRTEYADHAYTGPADIHVHDSTTGQDVPHQIVTLSGAPFLRVLAPDVPTTGYKVFEIRTGPGTAFTDAATAGNNGVLENEHVRVVLTRDGSLQSLVDKNSDVELVASIDGLAFNALLPFVETGEALRVENSGPVSVTVRARTEDGLARTTWVTLYRDSSRVDIRNELHANFSDVRHWAFSFNLDAPAVRTEEVGGINLNKRQSEGGDYAERNARYDYVTVNHFADITNGDGIRGVTLSNPDLAFAKLGRSTDTFLDTDTPQINMLAGGQVDGRWLGIQDQNGAKHFLQRFALRAHGEYDAVAAMTFALEHQNPLITGPMIGTEVGPFPADNYSLLTVSGSPGVLLWAVKPSEEGIGEGIVTRLWNVSDAPARATLALTPGITAACRTTHIETNLDDVGLTTEGTLPTHYARQQMQTYRLRTK